MLQLGFKPSYLQNASLPRYRKTDKFGFEASVAVTFGVLVNCGQILKSVMFVKNVKSDEVRGMISWPFASHCFAFPSAIEERKYILKYSFGYCFLLV